MPTLTVVAGPNGSGKSTLTRLGREFFQIGPVLDPDNVAKVAAATGARGSSNIDAGRLVLQMVEQLLAKQEDFLVETTLAGHTYLRTMKLARSLGYRVRLFYVATSSVEINMERIKHRVKLGGHDVPLEDQVRRFPRSLANFPLAMNLADEGIVFDNSTPQGLRKIFLKDNEGLHAFVPLPGWFSGLAPQLKVV